MILERHPAAIAAGGNGPALAARDLGFAYPGRRGVPERQALRDVTFEVRPGSLFCILGPNGSGKSTLFRILITAQAPHRGSLTILGRQPSAREPAPARKDLGVVFQNPAVDPILTVGEHLRVQGGLYGLTRAEVESRTPELLANLGLEDRADERVASLSGGLRRRVELAKALLHDPPVLIMDEPTTGLDPEARQECFSLLRRRREHRGTTVLFTTHLLQEAESADGVLILDAGAPVALGAPAELRAEIGGELIVLASADPAGLLASISGRFGASAYAVEGSVRIECPEAAPLVGTLLTELGAGISAVSISKPTIGDVYARRTGRRFRQSAGGGGAE